MQNKLLDIEQELSQHFAGHTHLSFKKFIEYLKHRIDTEQSVRTKFYRFALKKFDLHPELSSTVDLDQIENYAELFELIYASLLPLTFDENCNFWGLSLPMMPRIFYGTNALYDVLVDRRTGKPKPAAITPMDDDRMHHQRFEMMYSFLLEKLYKIPSTT